MLKKRWVYALILTGILAVGVSGGVIFAQSDGEDEKSPVQTFTARVATILGIEEATLEDAITQARRDMADEALQLKMDVAVEKGLITREDADAYIEWYKARPESLQNGHRIIKYRGHSRGFRGGHSGWFTWKSAPKYTETAPADGDTGS